MAQLIENARSPAGAKKIAVQR